MGEVILFGLFGFLALVLLVLVAPIQVRFSFGPETACVHVHYLLFFAEYNVIARLQRFGVLGRTVVRRGPTPPEARKPKREKKPKEEKKPKREGVRGLRDRAGVVWSFRMVIRRTLLVVARLVGRLLRSWRFQEGAFALTMGLRNPAHTGMATGMFHAVQPAMRRRFPRFRITLRPDFGEPSVSAEGELVLRLLPLEPVYHLARTMGTLPWRGLWKLKKAWTT